MSCDSWDSNADYDVVPMPKPGDHLNPVSCYLGEDLDKYVTHPYASPLFGDCRGLPPLLIQSGDAEVLRDEITLLAHKASMSGVKVRHELYEDAVSIIHYSRRYILINHFLRFTYFKHFLFLNVLTKPFCLAENS